MPLLSIIVPVFNVEKYISTCLLSILENDLDIVDYELIVVDDGSPDKSMEIVRTLAEKWANIQIYTQKNTGISGARNSGIRLAKGKYILFVDSDDWLKPNSLKKLVQLSEKHNLDILEFGIEKVNNNLVVQGRFTIKAQTGIFSGVDYYKKVRYVNSVFNKIYSRDLVINNQIFFIEKIYVEDYELNTRAFLVAKNVMGIPDLIYQYRQSPNSITRTKDKAKKLKMIEDHIIVLKETHKLLSHSNSPTEMEFLHERISFLVVSVFFLMLKNGFSYQEMKSMKIQLLADNLFLISSPVHQKDKNLFRKLLLKNFSLLAILNKVSKNLIS
jgi:glycosyltransferase involved in cell wall biosynthesis